jgi:hypothetical protein
MVSAAFSDDPFSGIFAQLRAQGNGNPIETGLVTVTCPTECHEEYPLSLLLEYTDRLDKCFWNFGKHEPSSTENWLEFDFRDRLLVVTAYTIRSGGSSHPKSWQIVGSETGTEWTTIHEVSGCTELNGPRKTKTFTVDNGNPGFRFIRYVQTENDSPRPERKWRINLKAIEFFGTLTPVQ